jgi:hypothetical protein
MKTYKTNAGLIIAKIIDSIPTETTFFTDHDQSQQVGVIVSDKDIIRHLHKPVTRTLTTTAEVLLIFSGSCVVDLYDDEKNFVASCELVAGNIVILTGGGHGFRMTPKATIIEVKQGPYGGPQEMERF